MEWTLEYRGRVMFGRTEFWVGQPIALLCARAVRDMCCGQDC